MARKAREISLINSYTVIFNSANGIAFNNNDIKTFLFVLNANKQEDNYKLKIIYDKEKAQGRDIFQDVQIKVHTEQTKI